MIDSVMVEQRPSTPVEFRAIPDFDVDFAERTIELVVMPYDVDAGAIVRGRACVESCAPGAFDGVERRANRVKVNRDHDEHRTVGRAVALHPSRVEGLVAELRIARTSLGDETLALADDHSLEASAGFCVMPGGERWLEQRSRRRLERLFLEHIAMVPEGAYEGRVLDVRSAGVFANAIGNTVQDLGALAGTARVPTPNLDQVRLWLLQDRRGGA
jgi:phage head maturation protease